MIILDYPSKKLLKEEVGRPLRYIETSMFGLEYRENGTFSGANCSAPEFLDSGLTVFASTLPRPARRGRVGPGRDFDSRISPASTVRCMSA